MITYVELVHYKLATESHRTETIVQEKDTEIKRLQALLQVLEVRGLYLQLVPCQPQVHRGTCRIPRGHTPP